MTVALQTLCPYLSQWIICGNPQFWNSITCRSAMVTWKTCLLVMSSRSSDHLIQNVRATTSGWSLAQWEFPPLRLTCLGNERVRSPINCLNGNWILIVLRRVRTWSGFDPHRSHTSIHLVRNWINPLQSCPHYELNSWRFVHKAQLWSRDWPRLR